MFDGSRSNQSSPYFSGGKRRRDSLLASGNSSMQPFLLGTSNARSPTQKRTRLSLGGSGKVNHDLEWSSFLNFQTPMRPSRQRSSNLRRRETIHSLPGQPAPISSLSSNSLRGGVMNTSPGFFVRDRNERQSVARALQILDSRKRSRELPVGKQDEVSDHPDQESAIDKAVRKRRRLTINGRLDDILYQDQTFASTSLGEITSQSSSCRLNAVESSTYVQKRMFTSSVLAPSESSAEPSSKRQRPGVNASTSSTVRSDVRKTDEAQSDSNESQFQSEAAQRRRLLSYMEPAQVEARYARQSAATELLSQSRFKDRPTAPTISRKTSSTTSTLATTGAQTELSCNKKEVLQKSPKKDGDEVKEATDKASSENYASDRKRRCQLSVKDFVAHLDRARSSTAQAPQSTDVLRRSAVDNAARRERLNRLRKLLSDVTREPTPPSATVSASSANNLSTSSTSAISSKSIVSNSSVSQTTVASGKSLSFGFGQKTSIAESVISSTAAPPKTSSLVIPSINVSTKPSTSVTSISFTGPTTVTVSGSLQSQSVSTAIPSLTSNPTKVSNFLGPTGIVSQPIPTPAAIQSAITSTPSTLTFGNQTTTTANSVATVPSSSAFNFGQANKTPSNTQNLGFAFGQSNPIGSIASQPSTSFAIGNALATQPNHDSGKAKTSFAIGGESSFSFGQSKSTTLNISNAVSTGSVASSATKTSTSVDFGKQPVVTSSSTSSFSFGESKQTVASTAVVSATSTQLSFGQSQGTDTEKFSFGQISSNQTPVFNSSKTSVSSVPTPFSFGSAVQPPMTVSTTSTASSMFPRHPEKSTAPGKFTFGSNASNTKAPVITTASKGGFTFGQQATKDTNESASTTGSMFSFIKPSKINETSSSAPSLFPFGGSNSVGSETRKTDASDNVKPLPGNSHGTGGFTFTPSQEVKAESKANGPANSTSSGLFSFGSSKNVSNSQPGSLFGNKSDNPTVTPTAATAFAFGSKAVTASVSNQSKSTPSSKSFSFGNAGNATAPATAAAPLVFGTAAKSSFSFGSTASTTAAGTMHAPSGAFSFGEINSKEHQQAINSVNPINKTNGNAGFTFHPPPVNAVNQSGGFSFGGPTANALGQSTNSNSPFAFGVQAPASPAQPAAGNMFSQTATSAPRKKTGLLRKRSTRK